MKKAIGFIIAAAIGGSISYFGIQRYVDQQIGELEQIEALRASHADQNGIHQVNYALPAETVDFRIAAQKTVDAVVHVQTTYELNGGSYTFDPIRHFFFGDGVYQKPPRMGAGAGSGVIMSADGYIVTNNHVIDGATQIKIVTNDNRSFEAEVIGQDPSSDLALLKVEADDLPNIEYGNSDQVSIGEWVLAVGNPFNLKSTVTAGIVSAKGRDINILANGPNGNSAVESFIQTDAAVNPGNSGGALVNAKGELIGINAAIKSNTGSYTGYSFAIPVNIVSKVVEDLLEYGAVQRGYLGVRIMNVNQDLAEKEDLNVTEGVFIANTIDMGAAKDAGIETGDVVVKIAERPIRNTTELQEQLSRFRPGDEVLVTVHRKGRVMDIPITLRNQFGDAQVAPKETLNMQEKLNALFQDVDKDVRDELKIRSGVQVKELGPGKLRNAGIAPGFIITKVDQQPVSSKEDLYELLGNKTGGVLIEGIYPNGKRAYYGFGL